MQTRKIGNDSSPESTLKFNMKHDESIRNIARKGYEVAKTLHSIGIKFQRVIPAAAELSMQKQFKLGQDSDLVCLEISMQGKNELDKQSIIAETKAQISILDTANIIDEGPYSYDATTAVYRFLLKINNTKR